MDTQTRKFPIIATLLTIICVVILCSLGVWQIQRLGWKQTLIAELDTKLDRPAEAIDAQTLLQDNDLKYRQVNLSAMQPMDSREYIFLVPRMHDGVSGGYVLVPVLVENDYLIMTAIGWSENNIDVTDMSFPRNLSGRLIPLPSANRFTPHNLMDQGLWYSLTTTELSDFYSWPENKIAPFILYTQDPLAKLAPIEAVIEKPRNQHLNYAVFWFTMAGLLCLFYYLRFIRKGTAD